MATINAQNIVIAAQAMGALGQVLGRFGQSIKKAAEQNRDMTLDELKGLQADADQTQSSLKVEIARREAVEKEAEAQPSESTDG